MTQTQPTSNDDVRAIIRGTAAYTSASILGPLLLFGGIGIFLKNYYHKEMWFVFIFVAVAFVVTITLLVRKAREMMRQMDTYAEEHVKK